MGDSSRFDTLRLLLPGAILITLVDLAARLTAATKVVRPSSGSLVGTAQSVVDLIEDPFRGIIIAFGMGLVLYFINPAYATPQYWKGIPSEYVSDRAQQEGRSDLDATGLYFLALNELMPAALRERALLYGQMYRIGFETVFYAILTAVAIAVAALVTVGSSRTSFFLDYDAIFFLAMLAMEILLFAFRLGVMKKADLINRVKRKAKRWSFSGPVSLMVLLSVGGWIGLVTWPKAFGPALVAISAGMASGIWMLLRLKGREWWTYIVAPSRRGTKPFRTRDAHSPFEILVLDAAFAIPWLFLLAGSSNALSVVHVGAPVLLTMLAFLMSHLRKYERQNHGVYRNQRLWLELNWEKVLAKVPPVSDA